MSLVEQYHAEPHLTGRERSKRFHERIAAVHAYRTMVGIDPEPYWPSMWMWELVTVPKKVVTKASINSIIAGTIEHYGITDNELFSPCQTRDAVRARHAIAYLSRKLTRLSFQQIASKLGRDHTVMIYAFRKVEKALKTDAKLQADIQTIVGRLS